MGIFYSVSLEQGVLFSMYMHSKRMVRYKYTISVGKYKYYYDLYKHIVGISVDKNNTHHLILIKSEYQDKHTVPVILDYNRISEISSGLLISYDEAKHEYRSYPANYTIINGCIESIEGRNMPELPEKSKPLLKFKKFYRNFPIYKFRDPFK